MTLPKVSLIILNWNGRDYLAPCLEALRAQTFDPARFEIVLVENGSSDGSADFVRTRFADMLKEDAAPRLKLIELAENQGFAGGNLAGLAHCDSASQYIATLNNDTRAEPGWLAALVAALEAHPAAESWAAAGGSMLFEPKGEAGTKAKAQIASAGIEVRKDGLALDRRIGEFLGEDEHEEEIFGVCAGAALYRREALTQVGFFDPAFFAYLEDADLAWRLRLAGWRSLYVPDALVWHAYSGTGKQGSPFKSFQLGRNRVWTILKNWPASLLWRHAFSIIFYDLAASVYTLAKRDIHPLRGRLAALHPRHLRRVLAQRRQIQRQRTASAKELENWLGRSASPLEMLTLRRAVSEKAVKHL